MAAPQEVTAHLNLLIQDASKINYSVEAWAECVDGAGDNPALADALAAAAEATYAAVAALAKAVAGPGWMT